MTKNMKGYTVYRSNKHKRWSQKEDIFLLTQVKTINVTQERQNALKKAAAKLKRSYFGTERRYYRLIEDRDRTNNSINRPTSVKAYTNNGSISKIVQKSNGDVITYYRKT